MRTIQVLGIGCPKCQKLYAAVEAAAKAAGKPYTISKVQDPVQIAALGVMMTPGLVIDGVVRCSGRIPSDAEIATYLA